ncbi:hypothetical protein M405DRAFT_869106 [Rhizopogon salebrosus TDB-379]|nr:hypothetical protein M405DRAFT_869106 [Rhizopogon salebrosus TDB-379]
MQFPWCTELNAIWHSNPSLAVKIHSSKLGVDHPTPSALASSANVAAQPFHPHPTIAQPIPVSSTFPYSAYLPPPVDPCQSIPPHNTPARTNFYDLSDVDVDIPSSLDDNDFYSDYACLSLPPLGMCITQMTTT